MAGRREEQVWLEKVLGKEYTPELQEGGVFLHRRELDLKQLYVEITSRCNMNCTTCIRRSWPRHEEGDMSQETFQRILHQVRAFPRLSHIYFGGYGEPLTHASFVEMVKKAKKLGVKVKITTNAMLLGEEIIQALITNRVNEIIVSCDSLEMSDFASIREGGSLEVVEDNLMNLARLKRKARSSFPRLGLEFVLMEQNKDQLDLIPDFARQVEAGSVLVTNLLPHTPEMTGEILYDRPWKPFLPRYWVSPERDFAQSCSMNFPRMAWGAHRSCGFIKKKAACVSWRGDVSPCYPLLHPYTCYVFGRKKEITPYSLGNIKDKELKEIWNSGEYLRFRHRVYTFQFPSCEDCDLKDYCEYPAQNEDCWGANPSCADCLWAQDIIRCP